MQGSLDNPPVIVRSSRRTALLMLLVCVAFTGTSIAMLRDPAQPSWIGYACAVFFGLGIPIFAARLSRPDTIWIGPSGLIWRSVFRTMSLRWRDVRGFRPYRPTAKVISAHIGFDFTDDYKPDQHGSRGVVRQLTGVEGSFGGGWELDADELASLLNEARARWVDNH
jgi:hypothetical protein